MRTQFRSVIYCSESALKDYCLESLKQNSEQENLGHDGCTSTNLSQKDCSCKRKVFFPHPVSLSLDSTVAATSRTDMRNKCLGSIRCVGYTACNRSAQKLQRVRISADTPSRSGGVCSYCKPFYQVAGNPRPALIRQSFQNTGKMGCGLGQSRHVNDLHNAAGS